MPETASLERPTIRDEAWRYADAGYLAAGLSIPHQKNPYFLFSLAVAGPILLIALSILLLISYVFIFL